MHDRLAADMELEAKAGFAFRHPTVHGRLRNTFNNPRCSSGVIEPLSGFRVDEIGFDLTHLRRMRRRWREVTREVRKILKRLPGLLIARNAEAGFTGSAQVTLLPSERREANGADWRSDATGFYE